MERIPHSMQTESENKTFSGIILSSLTCKTPQTWKQAKQRASTRPETYFWRGRG